MLDAAVAQLNAFNGMLYTYVLIGLLVGGGLVFTVRTRGVQFRHFGTMLRISLRSRSGAEGGISSFQAFAIGMATRIGIGNITGVALALILGGPGSIFWMWVIAAVGMATSFTEATLAQLFKERAGDGTFRGGPAWYLTFGLRSRAWGVLFAVLLVFAMVVAMPMVQGNTIAIALDKGHGVSPMLSAVILMVLTALVVFAGVRGVARAAGLMTPLMAVVYVLVAVVVIGLNITSVPGFLGDIVLGAFGLRESLAGMAGGMMAAILNGAQRGLFTNEAGMGTNPNAAATATVAHPVQQGFIQSLGVFVDSIIICTSTAFIILATGPSVYTPGVTVADASASLTTDAVRGQLGEWMVWPMTVMIFFFGFSSILGAFAYAAVNADFLRGRAGRNYLIAALAVLATGIGSVQALQPVWIFMDTAMAFITIVNLIGLIALSGWVAGALRDYEEQGRQGRTPVFVARGNRHLPGELPGQVWNGTGGGDVPVDESGAPTEHRLGLDVAGPGRQRVRSTRRR